MKKGFYTSYTQAMEGAAGVDRHHVQVVIIAGTGKDEISALGSFPHRLRPVFSHFAVLVLDSCFRRNGGGVAGIYQVNLDRIPGGVLNHRSRIDFAQVIENASSPAQSTPGRCEIFASMGCLLASHPDAMNASPCEILARDVAS